MTTGGDRNKDRFENWKICGVWKLPFCDHRAIKLTQNCVWLAELYMNLHDLLSVTREYHPKILELFDALQRIVASLRAHWLLAFLGRHNTSVFFVLTFSQIVQKRLDFPPFVSCKTFLVTKTTWESFLSVVFLVCTKNYRKQSREVSSGNSHMDRSNPTKVLRI